MECFVAQCEYDSQLEDMTSFDEQITVPMNATGAFVKYIYFNELDQIDIEELDVNSDDVKTAYISFGEYNEELDRCTLTGSPDDQVFFYSTPQDFPSLFSDQSGEDFLLVSEPLFDFSTVHSSRARALEDFPMQCVVMLALPESTMGKCYGAFENGGAAFDFIINSSESHGRFSIVALRNPDKKRDYHDWWLPEFSDGVVIPHDEWNFSK